MLKTYSAAVAAGAGNGVENEIFIPASDLIGSFTLDDAEPKVNYARGLLMFSEKLASVMSPVSFLKLGQTANPKAGTGTGDLHSFTFTFSSTVYSSTDPSAGLNNASVLPIPTSGLNSGLGDYLLTDIFPNAVKVTAEGAISGAGISFVVADLEEYGSGDFASINLASDARQLMMSIWQDLAFNQLVRAAGTTSSITASTLSGTTQTTINATQLEENNGTIGLPSTSLDNIIAASRTSSWTIQTLLDSSTNSYDVNVA